MRKQGRNNGAFGALVTLVLCAGVLLAGGRLPRAQQSLNLVYVESNIGTSPNLNSVFGFSNDGKGNLTALPGSPYLTGGTGVYAPNNEDSAFDADQQVTISPDGNLLFTVNGDTNTIAVFNINSDGSLTPVAGSPFPSGGTSPASVGLLWQGLFGGKTAVIVVNKNADPAQLPNNDLPNYTNFTTDSTGVLTPVPNGTIDLAAGSSPAQALVPSFRKLVVGVELSTSRVVSYKLNSNGTMSQVTALGPPPGGTNLLGEWSSPTSRVIYVGVPIPGPDLVGVYNYNTTAGTLTFNKTVSDPGVAVCWTRVNNAGIRLYTAESTSQTVSVYDVSHPVSPVLKQHITVAGAPSNLALDPTQRFLYVLSAQTLHTLNINTSGLLKETAPPVKLNLPPGAHPLGAATVMK